MFRGFATVTCPKKTLVLHGTWMYHPELQMWFINGCDEYPWGTSFHKDIVSEIVED